MSVHRARKKAHPPPPPSGRGRRKRVAVVTGTRAEFGLLVPVMDAIRKRKDLELQVVAAGAHFLKPARTIREVEEKYTVAARVPMQKHGQTGRAADASALGRGVEGFACAFAKLKPDWVVVLGDRIEAFAAASAASIAGIAVCHIHGGDRAEGIADEAMRHAITKLSHLHCAATKLSAERITKMGEKREHVHVTGSPAIDGLASGNSSSKSLPDIWKNVCTVLLLHPSGDSLNNEARMIQTVIAAIDEAAPGDIVALAPNHDPGRETIDRYLRERCAVFSDRVRHKWHDGGFSQMQILDQRDPRALRNIGARKWFYCDHLARDRFVCLLQRIASTGFGLLAGNSSAGLIEAPSLGASVLNVGNRQAGREQTGNIENVKHPDIQAMVGAIDRLMSLVQAARGHRMRARVDHPFGDGRTGPRIAALLAKTDPHDPALLRKRNSY